MNYRVSDGLLLALWAAMVLSALWLRPLLPVDETRYVSVAWEMWQRGDFLVPFVNGEPYAHKPPLLFWLIQLGWLTFGVNDWWPRLVAPLLALSCVPLLVALSRALWPQEREYPKLTVWLLFGNLFWLGFMTLVQFDLLLVVTTLLGMLGWWRMARQQRFSWLPGLAIGLGVLAKGPVILLHLLPVALLAPLWTASSRGWWRWYGAVGLSVVIGAALALAWAIPAGIAGGEAYRNAIFWGQTANRVVNSFAHREPWWWYLPMLPVLMLPWLLWPRWWRGLLQGSFWQEPAVKFLLAWLLPVLIALSLVSGKQIKYLLPLLPALALLSVRILQAPSERFERAWLIGGVLVAVGAAFATLSWWISPNAAVWLQQVSPVWGGLLLLAGVVVMLLRSDRLLSQAQLMALTTGLVVVTLNAGLLHAAAESYDLRAISLRIAALQQTGRKVAYVGRYHAQFNFLGRLKEPVIEVTPKKSKVVKWARTHSEDYLILLRTDWPGLEEGALYQQSYRGKQNALELWRASDWLKALPKKHANPGKNKLEH